MRSAIAGPVTPLLGSLGLHGAIALALLLAVRHPVHLAELEPARPDAWLGNAVEVDAVATPEAMPEPASHASAAAPANAQVNAVEHEPAPAPPRAVANNEPPVPDRSTPKPAPLPAQAHAARATKAAHAHAESVSNMPSPAANSGAPATTGATGAFGSEGLPPGVRSLPSAFTRAIPPATGADPIWQTLPIGGQRPFTIAVEVDADGHISSAEILKEKDGSATETQAAHLRERVVALLGGGLFALQNNVGAGRVAFRIRVTLSDTPVHDEDDPAQLVERGFEPPRGAAAGRAYFTLASGRHFEAKVQVLATP
ncbi:MAG TPA: hypothetical protein VGM29_19465 [Polyangiaceae bacterium]